MLRPAPDAEVLRSGLARELATVAPRPGGWERVRSALAAAPAPAPRAARRWGRMLFVIPFVAVALFAGATTAQVRSAAARPAEAPIVTTVCGVLVAIVTTGASRCEDGRPVLRVRPR